MSVDEKTLKSLIDGELDGLSDDRALAHIRKLRVEPTSVLRDWNYGKPGEQYPCWSVLEDNRSGTGIAYCECGFGPGTPWGLVWLPNKKSKDQSMGMDSGWYATFLDAFFDSLSATALPIWRVIKTESSGNREPITEEDSWDDTWKRVEECRKTDPTSRYDCGHSIAYQR